ncbi:MAG: response regulator [Archangium sp.]|nr:response regulator [Archangium sp.]MBM4783595.1 response regulator [Archangiaceae bacterium]
MKALVVDDSKMVRLVQQRALESLGWEVKQAANGEEGLETLQQMGEVQLVLADWQMPVMDGLAMVKRIRADARFANTIIIMVSSNAVLESIQEALDAGANDFVMKPFSVDALKERVAGAVPHA